MVNVRLLTTRGCRFLAMLGRRSCPDPFHCTHYQKLPPQQRTHYAVPFAPLPRMHPDHAEDMKVSGCQSGVQGSTCPIPLRTCPALADDATQGAGQCQLCCREAGGLYIAQQQMCCAGRQAVHVGLWTLEKAALLQKPCSKLLSLTS